MTLIGTDMSILLRGPRQSMASADASEPSLNKIGGGVIFGGANSPDQRNDTADWPLQRDGNMYLHTESGIIV